MPIGIKLGPTLLRFEVVGISALPSRIGIRIWDRRPRRPGPWLDRGKVIAMIFAALDQNRDTVQVRHLIEAGRSLQDAFIEAVS